MTYDSTIVILDVTSEKVKIVIQSLKNSSSSWDKILTFLAKECVDGYIEPLTYLIHDYISERKSLRTEISQSCPYI